MATVEGEGGVESMKELELGMVVPAATFKKAMILEPGRRPNSSIACCHRWDAVELALVSDPAAATHGRGRRARKDGMCVMQLGGSWGQPTARLGAATTCGEKTNEAAKVV